MEDSHWLLRFFQGNYTAAGWRYSVPVEALPKGKLSILAWVYDPDQNKFIPLDRTQMKEIVVE